MYTWCKYRPAAHVPHEAHHYNEMFQRLFDRINITELSHPVFASRPNPTPLPPPKRCQGYPLQTRHA